MLPDKACAVVLSSTPQPRILLFRHPLAGVQLVKGTIEQGETPNEAALRELAEESGIDAAMIKDDLGCWASGHLDQIWSFQLCQAQAGLPEQWSHQTLDDHGHVFEFFWAPLGQLPYADCHPVFQRALAYLCEALTAKGIWQGQVLA
ncbi:NUDIX domain-containing protein [Pseudomonas entomophila]|uniref:NUDIX hydrolase n=1 Tax=Pseudomonas entomophila TaxID=312306 RepID=UPI002405A91F|nr:NUDIX domain-containing protein [Pseudomonas entomophila]MDF9620046.1 NUDIX domain-containing protein [Pseudomonas entomophila]